MAAAPGTCEAHALEHVLDALISLARRQERVSVADAQRELGARGFGPFLFVPALVEISPVGGIPGVPSLMALIVAVTALQMLAGRNEFWLPGFLRRCAVGSSRLDAGLARARPVVRRLDRLLRCRLEWMGRRPWMQGVALVCLLCAAAVVPLELLPFVSSVPFSAIALIGLGLIGRDGAVVLLGTLVAAGAFVVVAWRLG